MGWRRKAAILNRMVRVAEEVKEDNDLKEVRSKARGGELVQWVSKWDPRTTASPGNLLPAPRGWGGAHQPVLTSPLVTDTHGSLRTTALEERPQNRSRPRWFNRHWGKIRAWRRGPGRQRWR